MSAAYAVRLIERGGGLWLLSVATTALTGNTTLLPSMMLLGSTLAALVPRRPEVRSSRHEVA